MKDWLLAGLAAAATLGGTWLALRIGDGLRAAARCDNDTCDCDEHAYFLGIGSDHDGSADRP